MSLLSGSTIPEALGLGYDSRTSLWMEKAHGKHKKGSRRLEIMQEWGTRNEIYAKKSILAMSLFKDWRKFDLGFWKYPKDPAFGFSPDMILMKKDKSDICGIEIKCPFFEVDEQKLPKINHVIQSISCMEMSIVSSCWYLYYWQPSPGKHYMYKIHRNEKFWNEVLFPKIKKAAEMIYNPKLSRKDLIVKNETKTKLCSSILNNYRIEPINLS